MKKIFWCLLLLSLLLTACAPKQDLPPAEDPPPAAQPAPEPAPVPEPEPPPPPPDPREAAVEALVESMTLEEKVGQLFFSACPAQGAAEKIAQYHLGGCLLFTVDFKDADGNWLTAEAFMDKIASFQDAADVPLFIGVDEEGGTVARASRNPNLFPEKFQSPRKVFAAGASGAAENAWSAGMDALRSDAAEKNAGLRRYGINVNFAPVADVSTNPEDFIYDRSFGEDAGETADFVGIVVAEMGHAKVGSVLKHFPGYGNNADTHTGIAIDERPYERFEEEDFIPFRAGISAGANAVLVSHNVVTCMDPDLPASLSPEVHRVLREELGFDGVILTDDLAMGAVQAYAEEGSTAVMALQAGNDMVVTPDFEKQIPLVLAALEDGSLDAEAIDSALRRVLGWKYDLGLLEVPA